MPRVLRTQSGRALKLQGPPPGRSLLLATNEDTIPAFINKTPPIQITKNVAFSYTFTASGSPSPTFAKASGSFPAGLNLSSDGVLSGTPTTEEFVTFQVSATNSAGSVNTGTIQMQVVAAGGGVGYGPPPDGGWWDFQSPGFVILTDAEAATRIHRSTWEPRPQNAVANNTVPPPGFQLALDTPDFDSTWNSRSGMYMGRVTGAAANYVDNPTTDELIQFYACKWGWKDNVIRGEMVDESNWYQSATGDTRYASQAPQVFDAGGDPWPTSFGLPQIKWYYHPPTTGFGGTVRQDGVQDPTSSYPMSVQSTGFALDYFLCILRGIYDGHCTFMPGGDPWGAIGSWFAGAWYSSDAIDYIDRVTNYTNAQSWRGWPG